jgi:hypothetical protein
MTRLETIISRQRKTLGRDLLFAAFVALAALIGVASVTTAFGGASTANVAKR